MILAYLLLLTGLTISAVAIYYSVVGLAAIFSAAVIPIIVMGSALEVAKLVCASWLKANWSKAPRLMKIYMTTAVIVLMLITSMGIFGFLSKAHSDQSLVSGDVTAKISIYDEKIKTEKDNIDANRKALKQLDEAVDQVMARSQDEKGADKAVAIRRAQQKDRSRLGQEITESQKRISALNEERAPIAAEVRKVEAEVGPLKYIAAFVYGATDESVLERAVTWVIITIIVVFDPLAVIMLLAAQMTFGWKKEEEEDEYLLHDTVPAYVADVTMPEPEKAPDYEPDDEFTEEQLEQIKALGEAELARHTKPFTPSSDLWPFPNFHNPEPTVVEAEPLTEEEMNKIIDQALAEVEDKKMAELVQDMPPQEVPQELELPEQIGIEQWNKMIEEAEKAVEEEKKFKILPELQAELDKGPEIPSGSEFPANPKKNDQFLRTDFEPPREFRFDGGQWIGIEEVADSDQKKNELRNEATGTTSSEDTTVGYVQNSEQSQDSIWKRIKDKL